MKKTKLLSAVIFVAILTFCQVNAFGEDQKGDITAHKVIRLHYYGGITPAIANVTPGTTVIWMNNSRGVLELQFEGKQVTMACISPVRFVIDENGSFISDRIPVGSVASLCFVEKGEYNYIARKVAVGAGASFPVRETVKEFKGKVIVK